LKGLNPKNDPTVYNEYRLLAKDLGSRAALEKIYATASRDCPQFFHFYADRAEALQEKWGTNLANSLGILNRFARLRAEKTVKLPTLTSLAD
jgi:hypothetical protein